MHLRVKLFATLRSYRAETEPGVPFALEVQEGSTVADLIRTLRLPEEDVRIIFVNGRARPPNWVLENDDEVGMFPPVGGG